MIDVDPTEICELNVEDGIEFDFETDDKDDAREEDQRSRRG